jgi:putative PEP-CTERM system histidine kinase
MAIFALVFTEQVVRNLNIHRVIKLLGLCLTFLFAYDTFMYGQSLISHEIPPILTQGRSALAFLMATLLTVGALIFNERSDSHYLFSVSRPAVFFSTTAFLSSLLIILISVGSYYVQSQGFLGTYLFLLALIGALLLIISLILSRTFRQHFEVFISKHFFALKYDYRIEWLNAIRRVSELKTNSSNYYSEVLDILKSASRSSGGSLWLNSGSEIREVCSTMPLEHKPNIIQVNEPYIRLMLKESWIFVPQSRVSSLAVNNHLLPGWISSDDSIWLLVPLIIQMKLIGFVILSKPKFGNEITYEDRDLMTNISTQVASHLLLHQQEKVISDAKQLETYNRLSAFIMHDINNVIAQLVLIGKNAERHKKNPAFVDDMIKTVHNATSRMQSLIQKFNPAVKEKRTEFLVSELLADLTDEVKQYQPEPTLTIGADFTVKADKQRLTLALKNIVRNAQEAARSSGRVDILTHKNHIGSQIIIEDNGHGMSQQFIDDELFRPFTTTKNERGVGIGAYLTKSYIEHLGAYLTVSSTEGEGTRFEITFS